MSARFVFAETWSVAAPPDRVAAVLEDLAGYPDWWPQVRAVAAVGPERAWVRCRAALPYTLDLVLEPVRRDVDRLEVAVSGDLVGRVAFDLTAVPQGTHLAFRQEVDAVGLLGRLAPLLRPVLAWNHAVMMRGCRSGLAQALGAAPPA